MIDSSLNFARNRMGSQPTFGGLDGQHCGHVISEDRR